MVLPICLEKLNWKMFCYWRGRWPYGFDAAVAASYFSFCLPLRELGVHLSAVCLRVLVAAAVFPARLPPCLTRSAPFYLADRSLSLLYCIFVKPCWQSQTTVSLPATWAALPVSWSLVGLILWAPLAGFPHLSTTEVRRHAPYLFLIGLGVSRLAAVANQK